MDICRVCMGTHTQMNQIFDSDPQNDIIDKVQFCTGVQLTKQDGLPTKICTICLEALHTAHKFKINCLYSENVFQNILVTKIKEELDKDISKDDLNDSFIINSDKLQDDNDYKDDIVNHGFCKNDDSNLDNGLSKEVTLKEELVEQKTIRHSKRVRLKKNENSVINDEVKAISPVKTIKKRGPYNKTDKTVRLKKLKFKRLWCEICKLSFNTKKDSDAHKKECHNEQNMWICEICGKTFEHRASHYAHMRAHYPPRFACEHCDYRSTSKYDLAKHVRIHTGSKSYVCPICACAYRTSSNMHAHVRLTHERVRAHSCPLCARAFYDRTKLNRHIDSHNDVKRFTCDVCHACFSRRCYWKKHLQRQHNIIVPASRPGRRRLDMRDPTAQEA